LTAVVIEDLEFAYPGPDGFRIRVPGFEIDSGECVAIVGPSGSGKTTLLGLVAGTLIPDSGSIRLGGTHISAMGDSARRRHRVRHIGQVFQAFELLEYLSVADNVRLAQLIGGADGATNAAARTKQLLDSVGLGDKAASMPSQVSQGESQRVAVCRALFNRPGLLLADEPTGNLDAANKRTVVDLLIGQARELASTLLMVTHDESLLESFDRSIDVRDLAGIGS
jgi:ABC-type lipoprotein export system ATPase subunit